MAEDRQRTRAAPLNPIANAFGSPDDRRSRDSPVQFVQVRTMVVAPGAISILRGIAFELLLS